MARNPSAIDAFLVYFKVLITCVDQLVLDQNETLINLMPLVHAVAALFLIIYSLKSSAFYNDSISKLFGALVWIYLWINISLFFI